MSAQVMHAWPKKGEPTSCCGRTEDELPLADGKSTAPQHVTCDGTFTQAVLAHDVYPHPSDGIDDEPPLAEAVKYHVARALALACHDIDHPGYMDRLLLMLTQREVALHVAALARGLSGQEALRWVHNMQDDSNECLYDLAIDVGVELDRIRHYPLPGVTGAQPDEPVTQAGRPVAGGAG